MFVCPLCPSPLTTDAKTWRCDGSGNAKGTRHPFDVARQGYVNLLPVQQKKSKAPGDSEASIAARQRFLAAGHYAPLQTLICDALKNVHVKDGSKTSINGSWLDIGCGEGYYTQAIAQTLAQTAIASSLIGLDISKPAVSTFAKAAKQTQHLWYQVGTTNAHLPIYPLVASAAHLPLQAGSVVGISSIFSPILPEVFAKVLADNGYLLIAKPDHGHLSEMRAALFDDVREHDSDKFLPSLTPFFELIDTQHISAPLSLSAADLADLMTMTPYAYRAHGAKRAALLARTADTPFVTEAKFVLYLLQKKAA